MATPEYCTEPETDLQRLLKEKGFGRWYAFSDEGGFYTALGLSMLLLTYQSYVEIAKFVRATFLPMLAPLREVEDRYGDSRYQNPQYWAELQKEAASLCCTAFAGKEQVLSLIRKYKLFDLSNEFYCRDLVGTLRISLSIHSIVEGKPHTKIISSGNRGSVLFFVNIAMDEGKVLALIHDNLHWGEVPTAAFPFYKKYGDSEPKGVVLTPEDLQKSVERDPRDTIIRNLVKMTTMLSRLTLASTAAVPRSQSDTLEQLKELHKQMAGLVRDTVHDCNLDGDELMRVMALPLIKEFKERPPHTIRNCVEYPEAGGVVNYHGHSFHLDCLRPHVEHLLVNGPAPITCPFSECFHQLPQELLDYYPDIKSRLEENRTQIIEAATTSKMSAIACQSCNRPVSHSQVCDLAHGCKACVNCYLEVWNNQVCKKCGRGLTGDDYTSMNDFYCRQQPSKSLKEA